MTLILKQIFAFFKLLNSDKGESQIAAGIACGFIMGLAPAFSLQTLLVIIILFFFSVQIGAAFLAAFFFKFIAYLFDPLFHQIGSFILEIETLRPLYVILYNLPIVPFTKFYNSVVMGAGFVSIVLSPFVYIVARKLIVKYRVTVMAKLQQTKLWKLVKATAFYKWYVKYDQLYG